MYSMPLCKLRVVCRIPIHHTHNQIRSRLGLILWSRYVFTESLLMWHFKHPTSWIYCSANWSDRFDSIWSIWKFHNVNIHIADIYSAPLLSGLHVFINTDVSWGYQYSHGLSMCLHSNGHCKKGNIHILSEVSIALKKCRLLFRCVWSIWQIRFPYLKFFSKR